MSEFVLNERLAADTIFVGDLKLSSVLLMNDARFAWLILVPRRSDVTELFALSKEDRLTLIEEIAFCSEKLKTCSGASKINVGALGNLVLQLHIHVVARRPGDAAWPGPVWGVSGATAYGRAERDRTLADIRAALSIS
jgi:diadenosine tetraphosphate (Ap4A) HIT family hydrolase